MIFIQKTLFICYMLYFVFQVNIQKDYKILRLLNNLENKKTFKNRNIYFMC